MKNQAIIFLFLAVIGLGLSACETMEGAGRDIQHVGKSLEESAE
ncbi:MAG: entericidin A/B family lipoprotein [Micavibrio sp.]|nr:MAG: entericidin A/B family lipoprotein [Micavibrio sp.]